MTPDHVTLVLDDAFDRIEQRLLPCTVTVLEALLAAAEGRGTGVGAHDIVTAMQDLSRELQVLDQRAIALAHDRGDVRKV